ncbi:hypothetical protein HON52_00040 [Candidatus Uhrbacteria bacterium]|jgi:hypothetical protein|nr:hypothetical protein [Candidatus Uhrbacteria bacterium]
MFVRELPINHPFRKRGITCGIVMDRRLLKLYQDDGKVLAKDTELTGASCKHSTAPEYSWVCVIVYGHTPVAPILVPEYSCKLEHLIRFTYAE